MSKDNMMTVYSVLYIHTDESNFCEVLGVFTDKNKAVDELLLRANYREKDGQLTQYFQPTNEYPSFKHLREKVMKEGELFDADIYRISTHKLV
jgi:hypothetical protein